MGEEEKKPEEKKMEEKKAEEGKQEKNEESKAQKVSDGKKEEKNAEESKEPPPPQEIVLRVFMHCEGCAKKVRRCLKGFDGVEDVRTDCRTHKVVVMGEKADPLKVLERVQKKSHRQVELVSPIPTPPPVEDAKKTEEKEVAEAEVKKDEPQVITVILKVHMHCDACAQEIKRRILRMKGVENVEPDLKSSQVTVKGVFDPPKLVDYVYKRTGKQALIVKQELEKKEEEKADDGKPEKKVDDSGDNGGKSIETAAEEKKAGETEVAAAAAEEGGRGGGEEIAKVVELKKSEFYYNYPLNYQTYPYPPTFESYGYYPPQMFSDENPNACSVM